MDQDKAFEKWWEDKKKSTYAQAIDQAGESRAKTIAREAWYAALNAQEVGGVIVLSPYEAQSGLDRQRYAQGLIEQLPQPHEGRDTWLLNYGEGKLYDDWRSEQGIGWDAIKRCALLAPASGSTQMQRQAVDLAPSLAAYHSAAAERDWFRAVCAEEMGVEGPGGEACHPLRDWLQKLRTLNAPDQEASRLLLLLRSHGGHLGALAEAGAIAFKKGQDYNTGVATDARDEYFPLGLASYAQMIWVKALRLVSFAKVPRAENNEGVRDTLLDLINYASFAADWLGRRGDDAKEKS